MKKKQIILLFLLLGTNNSFADNNVQNEKLITKVQDVTFSEQQQVRKEVQGTVTDQNDEPIIGANIIEKGTTHGTVTDINGRFVLTVAGDAVLQVSYIGYL